MNSRKHLAVFLFPALYATIARAEASEEVVGTEAMAMGGAAAAAPGDNTGITVNPATIALTERYDFQGQFRYGADSGLHWAGTVVDARTSDYFSLGLAYSGDRFQAPIDAADGPGWKVPGVELSNQRRNNDFAAALAVPLLERRLTIGVNGGLSLYNHDNIGRGAVIDGDVGVAARPVDWLVLGATARNVVPLESGRPFGALGGARLHDASIGAFEVDVGWSSLEVADPWTLAVGAEKTFGDNAVGRLGFRRDGPLGRRDVTVGAGLLGGGGSFDIGVAIPIGAGTGSDRGSATATARGIMAQVGITFGAPDPNDIEAPF